MRILLVSAFLILNTIQSFAQQSHAFPAFEQAPLGEVILYLEANFDLIFSYRDNNLDTEKISIESGNYKVKNYLPLVFEQTNLSFEFIDDRHLILTKKQQTDSQTGDFCAYVKDRQSEQLLPYANVLIKGKGKGTNTSQTGRFEINGLQKGDTLLISYVGYQKLQVIFMDNSLEKCPTFHLDIQEQEVAPIVVTVYLMDGILQDKKSQKIVIKPEKLSAFPGSVEPDIMTSIQMLPGVFSADETASGINIRGGTPDQNLVLWDGIPVYHTGHFFGMISAFNPYIVKDVNVYRSGIGSEFGGRVSGVIDIHTKDDLPKKFELGLGLNMTHGHINSRIPITKKSGITISMRRSFTDFLPSLTFRRYAEKVFQGTKLVDEQLPGATVDSKDNFYFADFNFKWLWSHGKNRFGVDMFSGLNSLDYTSELLINMFNILAKDTVQLENIGLGMYWARDWSKNFSSEIKLTDSKFNYSYDLTLSPIAFPEIVLAGFSTRNKVHDEGFYWTNTWKPQKNHRLKFGYQYTETNIDLIFDEIEAIPSPPEIQLFKHQLHTLFSEYHVSLADILNLDMGLRYQRQTLIKNSYFEPRVALTARINPEFKLKLSSSKQFQFVSQLVVFDFDEILFGDKIWVTSDSDTLIPVIESNQWTGGLLFAKNDWQVDIEGYVKELAGITSRTSSFATGPESKYSQGNSRIRGVDLLVKRQFNKNYQSWLSYTLSQSLYEFPAFDENVFPASHDRRHTFQWVHLYTSKPWEFSLGWQFGSGLPFTDALRVDSEPSPQNPMDSIQFIVYGNRNANRLPAYHRLDASLMYHFTNKDKFTGFFGLSLVNIYNRKNILGKQYLIEDLNPGNENFEILEVQKNGLRFTPNLVVRIQW